MLHHHNNGGAFFNSPHLAEMAVNRLTTARNFVQGRPVGHTFHLRRAWNRLTSGVPYQAHTDIPACGLLKLALSGDRQQDEALLQALITSGYSMEPVYESLHQQFNFPQSFSALLKQLYDHAPDNHQQVMLGMVRAIPCGENCNVLKRRFAARNGGWYLPSNHYLDLMVATN